MVHFLFIKDSDAPETPQRILVITDDLSHFVELIPCCKATAFVVAEEWLDWYKRFVLALNYVSDQGTHFKNQPSVQSAVNHASLPNLGGLASFIVFTGIPAQNPLDVICRELQEKLIDTRKRT